MSQPTLALSANATPGVGGQGLNLLHMIQCLDRDFALSVYCQAPGSSNRTVHSVPPSLLARQIGRVPVLRRRRDWLVLLSERNHDSHVAAHLAAAPLVSGSYFQGASGQCLRSLKMAKRRGACIVLDVLTLHDDVFGAAIHNEAKHFGIDAPRPNPLAGAIREEYRLADFLRVMSEPARATFLERGFDPQRVFVATPPSDLPEIPAVRPEPDPFTVSYVGLLEPAKGFHYLIEAFRSLDLAESRLWLWGNSGSRPVAKYLAAQLAACPRIQLMPFSVRELGHEKVYGASSVLVHPSLADGYGYVVAEAMASGIPVITTTATGASEWIADGVNGFVVAPGDASAIRDRLAWMAAHPAQRMAMGQEARRTMEKLTLERMRESYRQHLPNL